MAYVIKKTDKNGDETWFFGKVGTADVFGIHEENAVYYGTAEEAEERKASMGEGEFSLSVEAVK